MLDRLSARAGLQPGATVVVDRGMAFDDNIAEITARKLHYVVASRQPERDRWLAEFEDADGFTPVHRAPSSLNPAQKKTMIEVKTRVDGARTHVLCRSEQRIAKDRAIRLKQEGRLRADLDRLARRIADKKLVRIDKINQAIGRLKERYPRVARYFDIAYDPDTAALAAPLNADKYATAERLGLHHRPALIRRIHPAHPQGRNPRTRRPRPLSRPRRPPADHQAPTRVDPAR